MNKKVIPNFPKYGAMLFIITFVISLLTGCSIVNKLIKTDPVKKYVSTKNNLKFVVFPFNDYLPQIEFASKVEGALLQFGFEVVLKPQANKEVEERLSAVLSQKQGESKNADLQSLKISKYTVFEDIDADYFVDTMWSTSGGTIRVSKRTDRNILGVVVAYYADATYIYHDLIPLFSQLKLIKPEG